MIRVIFEVKNKGEMLRLQKEQIITFESESIAAGKNYEKSIAAIPNSLVVREDKLLLKFMKSKLNALNKLELLYDFMDEISEFVTPFTACKQDCNHCCNYDVSVSELEVSYIEKSQKVKSLASEISFKQASGTPCPLLENGKCTIYSSRPFTCRRRIIMTNTAKWCEVDPSFEDKFSKICFSEIDRSYHLIVLESKQHNQQDIREWFASK